MKKKCLIFSICFSILYLFIMIGCLSEFDDIQLSDLNSEVAEESQVPCFTPTKKEVVYLIWDGFLNEKKILQAFNNATQAFDGWSGRGYWIKGSSSLEFAMDKIDEAVDSYSKPISELRLLIIGKSIGGAKSYKLIHKNAQSYSHFLKTAMVLVDVHEPIAPGNEGICGYWYDYVYFHCDNYSWNQHFDLQWPSSFNNFGDKLAIFNLYQRHNGVKGYSLNYADENILTSSYTHSNIANSELAQIRIKNALHRLLTDVDTSTIITAR